MKQAAEEAFESSRHSHGTRKTIVKACLSYGECPVLEAELYFPRNEAKYYFLEKNLANYQPIAQIFPKDQILIAIWKGQLQQSAIENAVFKRFFLNRVISIFHL